MREGQGCYPWPSAYALWPVAIPSTVSAGSPVSKKTLPDLS